MSSAADDPTKDQTLEEHTADQGVTVEKVSRNGHEESTEVVKIHRTVTKEYVPLEGTEPVEGERKVVINEMPEGNAYETLIGLAELYGNELTPK